MIKTMTDLAADIPKDVALQHNIEILPFYINCENESILADINYTPQMFYKKFRELDEIPSTSQATPDILEEMYRKLGKDNTIIHVTISSNGSGIVNTARMLSERLNEDEGFDITVVDSRNYSYAIGASVVEAAEMAERGESKEKILDFLHTRYANDTIYFIVDDLKYLQRGGRIKATTMVISEILDIKPILKANDGLVEAFAKVRGIKKAISRLVDIAEENIEDPKNAVVYILHADAAENAALMEKAVRERIAPAEIRILEVGPVITCHAGIGVFGIYYKHKTKEQA